MRFRFCGELDAPDWLLAEISTISKLSSVRVRLIVGQILSHVTVDGLEAEKLAKQAQGPVGERDVSAVVAALHFVLTSAAKYEVDDLVLVKELEQLGLPREHAEAVGKPYSKERERLRSAVLASSLQLEHWQPVRWHVELPVASGGDGPSDAPAQPSQQPRVQLEFATGSNAPAHVTGGAGQPVTLATDTGTLKLLVHELKQAREALRQASEA